MSRAGDWVEVVPALAVFCSNADEVVVLAGILHLILMLKAIAAPAVGEEHGAGVRADFFWRYNQSCDFLAVVLAIKAGKSNLKSPHGILPPFRVWLHILHRFNFPFEKQSGSPSQELRLSALFNSVHPYLSPSSALLEDRHN